MRCAVLRGRPSVRRISLTPSGCGEALMAASTRNTGSMAAGASPFGGCWHDSLYLNRRAGFTDPKYAAYYAGRTDYSGGHAGGWGDPAETNGTMFYHSHTPDFTTANVYKGEAGMFLAFDERDTGAVDGGTGAVIGIDRFGESAPAGELFKYFGFTVENIVSAVKGLQ